MKIRNRSSKGKFVHLKIDGAPSKVWIQPFETLDLPYVTDAEQFVLNGHEKALKHVEDKFGINLGYAGLEIIGEIGTVDPEVWRSIFVIASTGGTTSIGSNAHIEVKNESSYSFNIMADTGGSISSISVNDSLIHSGGTDYTLNLTDITTTQNVDIIFM